MAEKERVETLESGDIFWFARPRVVGEDEQERPDQIQNLYMVLSPEHRKRYRLAVIGRQRLPDPGRRGRGRFWGFVDTVENTPKQLLDELKEQHYETKTRGERRRPAARPVGEGVYRVLRHGDHTHLVYALELPDEPGEVQEALNLERDASYIISVKNPDTPTPPQAGLPERAQPEYPDELMERFRGRKFGDLDPADFLDYEGTQFLLISAAADVKQELGIDLEAEDEDERSAETLRELRLRKSEQPVRPLFEGEWA